MQNQRPELYNDGGDDTTYLGNDDIRRENHRDRLPDDVGRVAYGNLGVEPALYHPRRNLSSDESRLALALDSPSRVT